MNYINVLILWYIDACIFLSITFCLLYINIVIYQSLSLTYLLKYSKTIIIYYIITVKQNMFLFLKYSRRIKK